MEIICKYELVSAPHILCVTLGRNCSVWDNGVAFNKYNKQPVEFGHHVFVSGVRYKLVAVAYHKGTEVSGGHYFCKCIINHNSLSGEQDKWCLLDDSSVRLCSNILSEHDGGLPYMFFYIRQFELESKSYNKIELLTAKQLQCAFDFINTDKAFNADECIIYRDSLERLNDKKWLNDELVNLYMKLLNDRAERVSSATHTRLKYYCFNSFIGQFLFPAYSYPKNWSKNINLTELDFLLVPFNRSSQVDGTTNNHWGLCVLNCVKKRFEYYDALGLSGNDRLDALKRYVTEDTEYDFSEWKNFIPSRMPLQKNGYDCGVFMLKYADYITDNLELDFDQADMKYFRLRIANEMKEGFVF